MPEPPPDHTLTAYLNRLVDRYERPEFIAVDPVSVPHAFDDPRDQEVIGLFAALLAWGRRATMLQKLAELTERMGHRPFRFITGFRPVRDGCKLEGFRHRTFRPDDASALVIALQAVLARHGSLEACFRSHHRDDAATVESALNGFSNEILSIVPDTPARLKKHVARPETGSACKRLNMYLRWMVRRGPVDLGIWRSIPTRQLVLPLDVHSGRQARALGLLDRKADDWRAALRLTAVCRLMNPDDPARYDFAFFGPGATGEPVDTRFTTGR